VKIDSNKIYIKSSNMTQLRVCWAPWGLVSCRGYVEPPVGWCVM